MTKDTLRGLCLDMACMLLHARGRANGWRLIEHYLAGEFDDVPRGARDDVEAIMSQGTANQLIAMIKAERKLRDA